MQIVPAFDVAEDGPPPLCVRRKAVFGEALNFDRREDALGHGVVVGIAARSHRRPYPERLAALSERIRAVLGGFNRSSQPLQRGGVYGATRRMDESIDRQVGDVLSEGSLAPARSRASVLGTVCVGNHKRDGGRSRSRVTSGRHSLIPKSWRHAVVDCKTCLWPISVIR